jgi:hypothetical protein
LIANKELKKKISNTRGASIISGTGAALCHSTLLKKLSHYMCLGLSSGLFLVFLPKPYMPSSSSMHAACPAHLILIDLIIGIKISVTARKIQ